MLHLGNYIPKNLLIEEGIIRSGRYSEGLALGLRHRDGSVLKEALTGLEHIKATPAEEDLACWERVAEAEDRAALKSVGSVG